MEWTCTPAGIADCAFAAGTGSLEDYPNLLVAGSVTYTVTGTVRVNASGLLVNTATVVGAFNDPTPDDHSGPTTPRSTRSTTPSSRSRSSSRAPSSPGSRSRTGSRW